MSAHVQLKRRICTVARACPVETRRAVVHAQGCWRRSGRCGRRWCVRGCVRRCGVCNAQIRERIVDGNPRSAVPEKVTVPQTRDNKCRAIGITLCLAGVSALDEVVASAAERPPHGRPAGNVVLVAPLGYVKTLKRRVRLGGVWGAASTARRARYGAHRSHEREAVGCTGTEPCALPRRAVESRKIGATVLLAHASQRGDSIPRCPLRSQCRHAKARCHCEQ